MEQAKEEFDKPFVHQASLERVIRRQAELNILLDMNKGDESPVADENENLTDKSQTQAIQKIDQEIEEEL